MQILDIHSHFFPKQWEDLQARFGGRDWPSLKHHGDGTAMVMKGQQKFRPIYDACWDPDVRLREMDQQGLCGQILSATPLLFGYERPVAQGEYIAKLFNDAAMAICQRGRGRLFAMAQVPLQDIDAACAEASRAKSIGHVGVQIGSHINGRGMDDAGVFTFLQHCADEDIPVFVHPWDMMGADRTGDYMMGWTVGMPAETQLSIVSLILSGAFDRLSRKLKIAFAHGGGSFIFLLGRLENAWHHRDIARGRSECPPSHYLDRFSLDSAVFDPGALRLLVDKMGDQRVMFGTDYPFPLGEQKMGGLIRETEGLSEQSRERLYAGNAKAFFGIE
ncbi:amidohydrolase family protein [Ferrimonas pelagia]|uniref:2-amino-3-carboxymuconate-6-semialdehyde decarboxylase n=2 Tax=Ferrimonas pelagia TaxID=1177826 RepID=A0ABP9ESY0_9GAMM